jgi:hypothetical protein
VSACPLILPCIQAVGRQFERKLPIGPPPTPLEPHLAFYRKYTLALLRRYVRMSMEAGKVPSMIGQEMVRKMSSYRVESFDDVVIFLADIDHCLEKLDLDQQHLIQRIALEEFTAKEVSAASGIDPRTIISRYRRALDRLTGFFLTAEILIPLKRCQEAKSVDIEATNVVSIT